MKFDKKLVLSKRYHFLFFDVAIPDFLFFISHNSLAYEFLREVHLLLHTDTEKENKLLILFNNFKTSIPWPVCGADIVSNLLCYLQFLN